LLIARAYDADIAHKAQDLDAMIVPKKSLPRETLFRVIAFSTL
jgi:hypothetical protein